MAKVKTPIHGRLHTYINWGCRCEKCRRVTSAYRAETLKKRRAALARMGFNVSVRRRRVPPAYGISDISRAVAVRRLLPKASRSGR